MPVVEPILFSCFNLDTPLNLQQFLHDMLSSEYLQTNLVTEKEKRGELEGEKQVGLEKESMKTRSLRLEGKQRKRRREVDVSPPSWSLYFKSLFYSLFTFLFFSFFFCFFPLLDVGLIGWLYIDLIVFFLKSNDH